MKVIDGVNKDGMLEFKPNFYPVIDGFRKIIGDELIETYLHKKFGEDADFNPHWNEFGIQEIAKGKSKGWADADEQLDFVYYILNQIKTETGYNYKSWIGKYVHIICK